MKTNPFNGVSWNKKFLIVIFSGVDDVLRPVNRKINISVMTPIMKNINWKVRFHFYSETRFLLGLAPITIWLVCWVTFPRIPTAASFTSAWYTSDIFAIHVIYNFPSRKWRFLVTNLWWIEMELIVITSLMIERQKIFLWIWLVIIGVP